MSESEWKKLDDEDEEFFEARINDEVHYILEWSAKLVKKLCAPILLYISS